MDLAFATKCTDRLVAWLTQHSERIQVAGSVRRGRPKVNDIDLVVIPVIHREKDLFGGVARTRNATLGEIERRAKEDGWTITRSGTDILSLVAKGVQVDVFWTRHETWGTQLLQRTGSREHNIWLAERAQAAGGKWHPFMGLFLPGRRQFGATEEDIYGALGLDWIPPERRERDLLDWRPAPRGAQA